MERKDIKVSIIVPVYHVEDYIDRCLNSLVRQTFKSIEIICICEPEDASFKLIEKWCQRDTRVRLIEKKNTGVSAARNAGIKEARGKYIAFVDADDWVEKHTMQILYQVADYNQAQIIVYGMWPNIEPHGAKRGMFGYFPKENVKFIGHSMEALFYEHGSRPYIGNKFYENEFLHKNKLIFDESISIGEDQLFQFEAFACADIVCYVKEKFYHYDISRNNSAMNSCEQNKNILKSNLILLNKILKWKNNNFDEKYDTDFIWWILHEYSGWVLANKGDEKKWISNELKKALNELKVDNNISKLPEIYNEIYQMINACANGKIYNKKVVYNSHMADNYMLSSIQGLKETLTIKFNLLRRINEAVSFHELKHFFIRVLAKLGMW